MIALDSCNSNVAINPNSAPPIDDEFIKYYDSFVQIAKLKNITLPNTNVYIQFSSDANAYTGECITYPNYKSIKIGKASWDTQVRNESFKEVVIFHELGHCVLNREHDNELLSNGELKTMMRGVSNNFFNYRGQRRQYYIDELFDPKTPEPAWSQVANFKDLITNGQKKLIFSQDFSTTKIADILSDDPKNMVVSANGLEVKTDSLSFSNFINKAILEQIANSQSLLNYEAELKIQVDKGFGGFRWYFTEDQDVNVFARNAFSFIIQPDRVTVSSQDLSFYKSQNNVGLQTLKIRKIKNDVFLFLNNELIAQSDILDSNLPLANIFGKQLRWHFMFFIRPSAKVRITDFKFYEITP